MNGTELRAQAVKQVDDSDSLRMNALAWLEANGVNTMDVPADPYASVVDGHLTIDMWVRGPNGGRVSTPDAITLARETKTFPVIVRCRGR